MTKRYFYTCPIKALYMMKEFGVKLECDYDPEDDGWNETNKRSFPFEHCMISQPEMIEEVISELEEFRKIYVAKESEAIFELCAGDLIRYNTQSTKASIIATFLSRINYDGIWRWELRSEAKNDFGRIYINDIREFEIILRDNKNLFTPESEEANDR